jgi:hypothetical protein
MAVQKGSTPVSKGERVFVIHGGGENGFNENALLMWKTSGSTGDYHSQMNLENYEKWLQKELIPNVPPHSVFVIDR